MTTDPPKASQAAEHPVAHPFPSPFNAAGFSAPGPFPPFFAYPHPPAGDADSSGVTPAPPYMMIAPHGMIYAFPPPGQPFPIPQIAATTSVSVSPVTPARAKRKQVKMACTNCASACKRCDEARPCERCLKYGISDTCVDGQRKERKKGIKRGPYKRKMRNGPEYQGYASTEGSEWTGSQPSTTPASPTTNTATVQAVSHFPPEGYYPVYYPPPPFISVPESQSASVADGSAPANGHPAPSVVPYYYPPYYPHPYGLIPQALPGAQPNVDSKPPNVQVNPALGSSQRKTRLAKKVSPKQDDADTGTGEDSDSPAS